jgi:hypothetical protein
MSISDRGALQQLFGEVMAAEITAQQGFDPSYDHMPVVWFGLEAELGTIQMEVG